MHVNNNSFRGPLIIGTFENWTDPEADAASISASLMTARESYGWRLSFQEFWPWISDEPPSLSLKAGTESKTEKKKTMWVKKVVEALGDSWKGHKGALNDSFLLNTLNALLGYLNY